MKRRHLMIGSVASIAVIVTLLVSGFAGAGSVGKLNASGEVEGSYEMTLVTQTRIITFTSPGQGKVAVFEVTVTGTGILMVSTADYNPDSYPDLWRATIFILRMGTAAWAISDVSQTNIGAPGSGYPWGPYTGRTDMMVVSGYIYLVHISYDRGSNVWPADCRVYFQYTGPSMTVTGPRPGF